MPHHSHRISYRHAAQTAPRSQTPLWERGAVWARLVLLLLALTNSGCVLATAGIAGGAVAGYAYFKGKLCETYNANSDDTWAAVRAALAELGMPILHEERKGTERFIECRTTDGERVRIHLQAETSQFPAEGQVCRVCVRVATFGDRPVSDRILDQVGMHLAPAAAPGAPVPQPAANPGVVQTGVSPASSPSTNFRPETAPPPLLPPEPTPTPMQTPR
jgi:hypothetical protein